jgi:hypothetical protein
MGLSNIRIDMPENLAADFSRIGLIWTSPLPTHPASPPGIWHGTSAST